jgi:hypothetical protein
MTLGTDISMGVDLDPGMSEVGGRRALADAIVRRLSTPTGGLPEFPAYGLDLTSYIGRAYSPEQLEADVLDQVFQEEEVEDASVQLEYINGTISIVIAIDDALGPFDLTISIDEVDVSVTYSES